MFKESKALKTQDVIDQVKRKAKKYILNYYKVPFFYKLCVDNQFLLKHVVNKDLFFEQKSKRDIEIKRLKTIFKKKHPELDWSKLSKY